MRKETNKGDFYRIASRMKSMESNCDPRVGGAWEKPFESNVVGIHTALLHTGQVLFFTYPSKMGNHHEIHAHSHGSADVKGDSEVFDPVKMEAEKVPLERNIFCGGTCFLEDGRLFVAGGQYQTFYSLSDPPFRDIHTFNPDEKKWVRLKQGNKPITMRGRWYPSCITLSDGRILIISGRYSFMQIHFWIFRFVNNTLQIYDPKSGSLLPPESLPFKVELYPFLHLLPSGKVFVHSETTTRFYDPMKGGWDMVPNSSQLVECKTEYEYSRTNPGQGTCVLLPLLPTSDPPYRARVLLVGGAGSNSPELHTLATNTAEMIDFGDPSPRWRYIQPMHHSRVMPDGIILPDGKIMIVSGSGAGKSDLAADPVLEPEIFDPETKTWTKMCPMTVPRLYHATAILLPDARVLVAGTDAEWNKKFQKEDQRNVEIFRPPYLFRDNRPQISSIPSNISHNSNLDIKTSDAENIASVALIRPGAVTHSVNTDQRYIGLEILSKRPGGLTVASPPNANVAPAGWYMLFIINDDGVPSVSKFVRVR